MICSKFHRVQARHVTCPVHVRHANVSWLHPDGDRYSTKGIWLNSHLSTLKTVLVFDNVPDGRIFDGYAMAALFCGLSVLSGFMNNMICIGGCLTMLIFIVIKLAISMVIGIIALPISVAYNLYNIAKAGAVLVKSSF